MKYQVVSFLVYWFVRLLIPTLRLRVVGEESMRELEASGKGVILLTWHGRTVIPICRFRRRGYWAMISTSRDGEYQNRIFQRFGWNTVRGSTSARGAVQAALTIARQLKAGGTMALTPDGPRGPIHVVQPGAIFLARKSGSPIVPVGISAYPRKLAHAWDRYMIPLPFARAVLIYGEPITIPPDVCSEEDQQIWCERVGAAIAELEAQAEQEAGAMCAPGVARLGWGLWRRA